MCCFSTHKLKLIVAVLCLIVLVDGQLKLSTNATLLYYYYTSSFKTFLIGRIVLGFCLAVWAFFGFIVIFYDSVCGVAVYALGCLMLTVIDGYTLYVRYQLNTDNLPKSIKLTSQQIDKLEEGLADIIVAALIAVQVLSTIAGLTLAFRLRQHQANEIQYEIDKRHLKELRRRKL